MNVVQIYLLGRIVKALTNEIKKGIMSYYLALLSAPSTERE